jgi:hypothetical protein
MSPVRMRWNVLGVAPAAVAAFIGLTGVESHPAIPTTAAAIPGTIWLADSTQDQLNQMEQQQAQQTAQQTEDLARQEQQLVDQQNAFNESMTAGNN